jgi:hypothetical protein
VEHLSTDLNDAFGNVKHLPGFPPASDGLHVTWPDGGYGHFFDMRVNIFLEPVRHLVGVSFVGTSQIPTKIPSICWYVMSAPEMM